MHGVAAAAPPITDGRILLIVRCEKPILELYEIYGLIYFGCADMRIGEAE